MDAWWSWLAVAGAGVLHGLNPATGWPFAACWHALADGRGGTWRALLPIALGHAASVAFVAGTVLFGVAMRREAMIAAAAAVLAVLVAARLRRWRAARLAVPAAHAGLALWSFTLATVQGAGLMLVPALMPLCLGAGGPAATRGFGPLATALGVVAVHMAAMLATTGATARGASAFAGYLSSALARRRGATFG